MVRTCLNRVLCLALTTLLLLSAVAPALAARGIEVERTPEEQAFLEQHGPFRVGFVQDRIPVSFSDDSGDLAGITRYILDLIARRCGMEFEYIPLPAGQITYQYLTEQRLDLVTSVEYNQENLNANGILTSEPYLSSRKVVVAREDLEFSYSANHTVAISTGSQTLRKVLNESYPNFTLVDFDSITDCFDAVNRGEVDLMMQNQYVVEYWISRPMYNHLQVIPVLGMADELCFSAVVSYNGAEGATQEEGEMLIQLLNRGIASLTEDEVGSCTIRAIAENKYVYNLADTLYHYRLAIFVLAASLVIIVILVIQILRLRVRSLAEQADSRAKGQFLNAMSHEIRTPLNGLIGLNYLMGQNLQNPERLQGYLRQSDHTARYLQRLVNDVLDMSSLQDEDTELVLAPTDLELLLTTACSLSRDGMERRHHAFETQWTLPHPWLQADADRVQQVILQLLDNAMKFTPDGGRILLTVSQREASGGKVQTIVTVKDTGRGMSEAFQKQVFSSFSQERDTVSKGNQGTGLGLPISRKLALLMGGDITFTSALGQGSIFTFTFLAEPAEHQPEERTLPAREEQANRPGVLVAEDNELNAEILMDLLEAEGFPVALAEDGQAAVDLFAASEPGTYQVILMDILMPRMDGCAAASAIRALPREDAGTAFIIACTANAASEERERAMNSGMDAFLMKPVDIQALLQLILDREAAGK